MHRIDAVLAVMRAGEVLLTTYNDDAIRTTGVPTTMIGIRTRNVIQGGMAIAGMPSLAQGHRLEGPIVAVDLAVVHIMTRGKKASEYRKTQINFTSTVKLIQTSAGFLPELVDHHLHIPQHQALVPRPHLNLRMARHRKVQR